MPLTLRLTLATATLAAWLLLLFTGHLLGGAAHLLLAGALALFPWSWLRRLGREATRDRDTGP